MRSSQLSYGPVVVDAKSAPFVTPSRPSLTALPCVSSPEQTRFAAWGHVWDYAQDMGYQQTRTMRVGNTRSP